MANTVVLANTERIREVVIGHVNAVIKMDYEQIVSKRISCKQVASAFVKRRAYHTTKRRLVHADATDTIYVEPTDPKNKKKQNLLSVAIGGG